MPTRSRTSPTALTGSAFGFGDLMVDSPLAPLRSWEHRHVFRSAGDPASSTEAIATSVEDDVTVELPRAALLTDTELGSRIGSRLSRLPGARIPENQLLKTLRSTFAARTDRLHREFDFLRQIDAPLVGGARPLRILVSGASGLVGTQLCALLMTAGHTVRRLVRHEPAAGSAARARTAGDPATASAAAAPGTTSADDTAPSPTPASAPIRNPAGTRRPATCCARTSRGQTWSSTCRAAASAAD